MKTIAVYVLTSLPTDYYLEQLIISAYSLRLHNPEMRITIVVDKETSDSFIGNRRAINEYVSEIITVDVPVQYNQMQKSRFLKTTLREIVTGDYLFIDTDTVITSDLSEIDSFTCSLGAVLDKHIHLNRHSSYKSIVRYSRFFNWKVPNDGNYFNSGIMYVKDDPIAHTVYRCWHQYWVDGVLTKNISIDQPSLAKANEENGYPIAEMSGIFNCQVIENGLKYLLDAKIIHYYASNINSWDCPYLFREKALYSRIRQNGIDSQIHTMILSAKSAFNSKCLILGGNLCDAYYTTLSGISRRIFSKMSRFNTFIDCIYNKLTGRI